MPSFGQGAVLCCAADVGGFPGSLGNGIVALVVIIEILRSRIFMTIKVAIIVIIPIPKT